METTSNGQDGLNSYRKTAITVGVIYLAGMVVGIGGNVLIQSILGAPDPLATLSANSMLVAAGAMLWLLAVAGDAAHGILMFPILILLQIPLGTEYVKAGAPDTSYLRQMSAVLTQAQLYAYHFGMITVGFAGLMLNYVLYRAQLLPRVLGLWGLGGYAVILCGSVLEALGLI